MKKFTFLLTMMLIFTFSVEMNAQQEEPKDKTETSEFTLSGEIRPRMEYNHGLKTPLLDGVDAMTSTSQRTRLNFDYKESNFKVGVSLQDVRTWGNQAQLVGNENFATSVHQAWGEFMFTKELSLKAGRMELVYDDHRILGNVGWAQQARSHDLALLKYEGSIKVHLGLAYYGKNFTAQNFASDYKAMQFLWLNGGDKDAFSWSVLALNNGKEENQTDANGDVSSATIYSQTIGVRPVYKAGALTASVNAYYQMGKLTDGTWVDGDADNTNISAYNFALDVMYKVNDNISAGFGYEMLSGNDFTDATATDQNAFAPLYGTNHKFNGWMDYFYVGNHANSVGLQDISLKLFYSKDKFFVKLIPHYFMIAGKADYIDADGNTQSMGSLGTEIDLTAGYKASKNASIEFGYSHMLATDGMYALKNVNIAADRGTNNWAWVMLTLTPQFLNSVK